MWEIVQVLGSTNMRHTSCFVRATYPWQMSDNSLQCWLGSSVCSHGDRLSHLINKMWNVSSLHPIEDCMSLICLSCESWHCQMMKSQYQSRLFESLKFFQLNCPLLKKNKTIKNKSFLPWYLLEMKKQKLLAKSITTLYAYLNKYIHTVHTFNRSFCTVFSIICNTSSKSPHPLHVCESFWGFIYFLLKLVTWLSENGSYLCQAAKEIEACVQRISFWGVFSYQLWIHRHRK